MIIDLILNRKDGSDYQPRKFYNDVMGYGEVGWGIAEALDNGTETEVKKALSHYIVDQDYNPRIIEYVNSVSWL